MTNVQIEIRDVFAEVTRYPVEVLDLNASLEEDLGIDSVKLGEVFSVLRERFQFPADLDIPKDKLSTIAGVAEALSAFTSIGNGQNGHSVAAAPAVQAAAPAVGAPSSGMATESVEERVLDVFAEITRYPREVLDPTADLEEDLGIDSVKLGEVFSVLRERYALPTELDIPKERLRSLREVAVALGPYLAPAASAVDRSGPMPVPVTVRIEEWTPEVHARPAPVPPAAVSVGRESIPASLYAADRPTSKPFAGKVLFVSGSGRGLGKDIASYLAELGASVV